MNAPVRLQSQRRGGADVREGERLVANDAGADEAVAVVFGERLRAIVLGQYETVTAFANEIGMQSTQLTRILNGHSGLPKRKTLQRFGSALGMSVGELRRVTGISDEADDEDDDSERGVILALLMAHPQAGPMLVRLKAEAPADEYPDLLDEALEHFALSLGRRLRRRKDDEQGE